MCIACALAEIAEYSERSVICFPLLQLVIVVAVGLVEGFWHIRKLQSVVKKLSTINTEQELKCILIR